MGKWVDSNRHTTSLKVIPGLHSSANIEYFKGLDVFPKIFITSSGYFVLYPSINRILCDQVWFQNQRAKMKKIQKKARLDAKNNNKDGDSMDDKSDKLKEDDHSEFIFIIPFLSDLKKKLK